MKRVLVIFAVVLALAPPLVAQTMKVSFSSGTEGFKPLLEAVYAELGMQVEWVSLPSERSLQALNAGEIDADIGRAAGVITASAYPNIVQTTESLVSMDLQAWAKAGAGVAITGPTDLKKYKVVLVRGNKLPESFVAAAGIAAESVADLDTLSRMLVGGRADVALVASAMGFSGPDFVLVAPKLVTATTVHILNKKWASLVPKFDAVVKAMKADGRLSKLLSGK